MKHFKIILNIESLSCTGWGSKCVWSNKAPKHCLQKYKIPLDKLVITALIFCEYLYWLWLVRKLPSHTRSKLVNLHQSIALILYPVSVSRCNQIILMDNFHHTIKILFGAVVKALKFSDETFIIFQLPDDYQYSWKMKWSGPSQQEMCHKSNNHQPSRKRNFLKT